MRTGPLCPETSPCLHRTRFHRRCRDLLKPAFMKERCIGEQPDRMPDQSRVIDVLIILRPLGEHVHIADSLEGQTIRPFPPVDSPEPLDEGIDRRLFGEAHIIIDVEGDLDGLGADEKVL